MDSDPFGSRYAHGDGSLDTSLLEYLDRLAQVAAVGVAKRDATAALELQPGQRVLEIGCGTGVDLPLLAQSIRPGGTVVGLDRSAEALHVARGRVRAFAEIELAHAHVERLPFANAEFDACRADRTLQHVPEPEQALAELRRVMRRGARLVVLEMTSALQGATRDPAIERAIGERMWSADAHPDWLPLLLPLFLSRTGFEAVEVHSSRAQSASLAEAEVVLRLRASLDEACEAGTLEREVTETWLAHLQDAETQGALALHMQFVRILAVAA